jgi:hypothetical protein
MLKEKIQKEMTDALKAGDQTKRITLGMLMNSVKNKEIVKRSALSKTVDDPAKLEEQSHLNDDEILEVIASEVKKRKESIEQFELANRKELAEKEKTEMSILTAYMPEQMGEDDIRAEVVKTISALNAQGLKDMGKVIGAVVGKLKGKADGGIVSRIAKELLA